MRHASYILGFASAVTAVVLVSRSNLNLQRDMQGTPEGSTIVATALKDVQLERIVGPSGEDVVRMGSFWQDQPVVLHMMRRFGCRLCRGGAQHMSKAIPLLQKAGVRCVAIGPEPLGVEEFVAGGYWAGELYVDEGKKAYQALQLKSLPVLTMLYQLLFHPTNRKAIADTANVQGNFRGDGMQLGATIVMDKGGAIKLDFRQETAGDHVTPETLLKLFNIDVDLDSTGETVDSNTCQEDQCK